ncbi:MAG: peptide chain release factor 2 [Deltaproteobacteria bacterium]|nr:peptide chain release factor 2 [Deltaproteobacteria bacterium]
MLIASEIKDGLEDLSRRLDELGGTFDLPTRKARLEEIEKLAAAPDFWNDQNAAQTLLKEKSRVESTVAGYEKARGVVEDAEVLFELAREEGDESQYAEVAEQVRIGEQQVVALEFQRMLSGEDDGRNAIVTINSGAGGVDAQDWAEMLLRMYGRFAERNDWKVELADRQDGEEAGIKSAALIVQGDYAYGYLKAEAGVHRLVRMSPFDAAGRRHTAFASVYVSPEIDDDIAIEVREEDVRVDVFRASGAGGQKVNKTSSAVRMTHMPTGIVVSCQNERSQHKNRDMALKILKSRLYELEIQKREAERAKVEASKAEISFGSQIRSYVLAPYQMVKDHRTSFENGSPQRVLDGDLDGFIQAFLMGQGAPSD